MKIILSPSKTQDFSIDYHGPVSVPAYQAKAFELNALLQTASKEALGKLMKINGDLLDETYANISAFMENEVKPCITVYTGLVYKYFDLPSYGKDEISYLNNHLCILSAQYGVLKPYDGIHPYRLDMKMKPEGMNLYAFWQESMVEKFLNEDVIIDLASNEFSKMVKGNKITVGFRDCKNGKYKNLATYSKMARGMLLHQMIMNKTQSIDELKQLTFDRYRYNDEISTDNLVIFSRFSV